MYKHSKLPKPINAPINIETILRKHKTKVASLQLRHDIIQATKRQNYINEYDRINGYLSHNITHGHVSHAHLTARKETLKELFQQSFKPQMHELYSK